MKNNYFYTLLLAIPVLGVLFISWSGGYNAASVTGSPGDGGSTCANCHSGGTFATTGTITTNIPATGYALNTTYTVTVTFTGGSGSKRGFQVTAEKSGGTKVGTFTAGTGSQVFNSGKTVTHNNSTLSTWTFNWTSPSTNQGTVTFYAALNATNGNGGTSGDKVITTSTSVNVLGNDEEFAQKFKLYPNPTLNKTYIDLPENIIIAQVTIFDFLGKQVLKTSVTEVQNDLDVSQLKSGTYILSIQTESGEARKKLVIQ